MPIMVRRSHTVDYEPCIKSQHDKIKFKAVCGAMLDALPPKFGCPETFVVHRVVQTSAKSENLSTINEWREAEFCNRNVW